MAALIQALGRHAETFRLTCLVVSTLTAIIAIGGGMTDPRPRDALWLTLAGLLIGFNALTLFLLSSGDREERQLRAKLRKLRLQAQIKEGEYLLDPRGSISPSKDAERLDRFLARRTEA